MLERELEHYRRIEVDLLEHHEGKYTLIHGDELVGVFDHDKEAYADGIKRFGLSPFLIRLISKEKPRERYPALELGLLYANS